MSQKIWRVIYAYRVSYSVHYVVKYWLRVIKPTRVGWKNYPCADKSHFPAES